MIRDGRLALQLAFVCLYDGDAEEDPQQRAHLDELSCLWAGIARDCGVEGGADAAFGYLPALYG